MKCECCQDTTSDNEKEVNDGESQSLATLQTASSSNEAQESNEAVALADSSTMSTELDQVSASALMSHATQRPATRNRLLMQLLAGSTSDKTGVLATSQSDSAVMSTQSSQSVAVMSVNLCATASSELSEDLNSVSVTDLLSAAVDLLPASETGGTSDVDDQLLMAQLEQAIMNSELSLEDLDRLLAVSSTTNVVPVTASSANVQNVSTLNDKLLVSQCHPIPLGKSCLPLSLAFYKLIYDNL